MQTYFAPIFSTSAALSTLFLTFIKSIIISELYFLAALIASFIVLSSEAPNMEIISAPAFDAISVSKSPVSIVFISAIIFLLGKIRFNSRIASIPSLLIRGVPASIQSIPPGTASFAIEIARSRFNISSAS